MNGYRKSGTKIARNTQLFADSIFGATPCGCKRRLAYACWAIPYSPQKYVFETPHQSLLHQTAMKVLIFLPTSKSWQRLKGMITAFAGVDTGVNDSRDYAKKHTYFQK